MTPFKLLAVFVLIGCSVPAVKAQTVISGTITDAHTKEPVTYASVYFARSGVGKTSDSLGNFTFVLNNFNPDTLIISYIGYDLFKIPVTGSTNNKPLQVQLQRGGANNVVVVKTKFNKGLYLWKKIMSRKKQYNRYNLPNFGYEAYNKLEVDFKNFNPNKAKKNFLLKPFGFVFDNMDSTSEAAPFLPAYLIESVSDYAYQKNPKKFYENIRATNTKGLKNESINRLVGVMDQNVNVYSNYVNIMDKDFISPFHDNGDNYYTFTVPDTQLLDGKKLFHFVFTPKRPGQNTFEGDAWVVEKTFQIQRISLYLGKDANINYIDRVSIFQEFHPINDTVIFLNRDKFFADFRALGKNSLTLIGRKSTSYKNIQIDSDSIRDMFKGQKIEELVKVAPNVQHTDSAWSMMRHDTLSANEKAIYTTIDKLLAMPRFKRFQRNLRFLATGYRNVGNYEIGPWFNWVSGNQWEGMRFRFDLGTNKYFNKNIYLHGYLAYGTRDQKFKGLAEAIWVMRRTPKRVALHVSYSNDIDNGISQLGEVSQDNVFSLAIRKPGADTTRKFLGLKELKIDLDHDLGRGFSAHWYVAQREYTPLQNLPVKSQFPVSEGKPLTNFEVAVKLRWAYLEKYYESSFFRTSLGSKYPIAELTLAKGISGIFNSAYSYTKVLASIKKNEMKISPFGEIDYKIYGGFITGKLPFAFIENHPGNDIYYYNQNAYNLMRRFEYISDRYAGVNLQHNIGSGLFRFIPITRKLKWRQFWTAKALWGSLSDANKTINKTSGGAFKSLDGKTYIEVGTGIDNIFKLLRFDFVWRLGPTPLPENRSSRFGIFGSFSFHF